MALSPSDPSSASSNLLLLCAEDADDVASWEPHDPDPHPHPIVSTPTSPSPSPSPAPFDGDEWRAPDDRHVSVMLAAEPHHSPRPDYLSRLRDRSLDATSRHDAVNWILKVCELYRFRPVTPCLAVSYLDRFLSSRALPGGGEGWATELVSVASVWVAAKMEETQVPGLLELQTAEEGPRRVFDPRTVRRMELLLMSALAWRMRSPTPFDYLPHFAPRRPPLPPLLLARASSLVLNAHRVVDFLGYRASEIAASAVLCAAREIGDSSPGCDGDELATSLAKWVSKTLICSTVHKLFHEPSAASLRDLFRI
ncbi:Cyclin-D2-1 [Ananas comosus]|uniref:Cyclin-D2-1 n=1 Tax=Ananas comosus TaxID=4615 RepID=A0A199V4B6_ANACO|nr:Cyclin-D2-1 [Ananas comosus]